MADNNGRNWRTLAQLAAQETDPQRLLEIVTELNAALEKREDQIQGRAKLKRLLLVDHDPCMRFTLLPVLRQRGFEAEIASTVSDALKLIETRTFEILVNDLNIAEPGDGFRVVIAMRSQHPRSLIVLLTGDPAFDSALGGIRQKVDDCIVKPVDCDCLIDILERRLAANGR